MDRDFTWNKSQAQIDYENALAAAAAAGARNGLPQPPIRSSITPRKEWSRCRSPT